MGPRGSIYCVPLPVTNQRSGTAIAGGMFDEIFLEAQSVCGVVRAAASGGPRRICHKIVCSPSLRHVLLMGWALCRSRWGGAVVGRARGTVAWLGRRVSAGEREGAAACMCVYIAWRVDLVVTGGVLSMFTRMVTGRWASILMHIAFSIRSDDRSPLSMFGGLRRVGQRISLMWSVIYHRTAPYPGVVGLLCCI